MKMKNVEPACRALLLPAPALDPGALSRGRGRGCGRPRPRRLAIPHPRPLPPMHISVFFFSVLP